MPVEVDAFDFEYGGKGPDVTIGGQTDSFNSTGMRGSTVAFDLPVRHSEIRREGASIVERLSGSKPAVKVEKIQEEDAESE